MVNLKFGHIAIIFGVTGIALLYVVTALSQPVLIADYNELENHEGEVVSVEGAILSYKYTDTGELVFTIYGNKQVMDIVVENHRQTSKNLDINSVISATGEVQMDFNKNYEIVVIDEKNIEVIGKYEPVLMDINFPEFYNNTYIKTAGTISSLEKYYGDSTRLTLRNGTSCIESILYGTSSGLNIGDNIEVQGIARKCSSSLRVYIYSANALSVTGHWEFETVGLLELGNNPESYMDFPVAVSGFVRTEPYFQPAYSLYLTDNPYDSGLSLRVELVEIDETYVLHKGDFLSMLTYTCYDPETLRFYLMPVTLDIIERNDIDIVTITELSENYLKYERALINLTGYIHSTSDGFILTDRGVLNNSSIILPLSFPVNEPLGFVNRSASSSTDSLPQNNNLLENGHHGSRISLPGRLEYTPHRFSYSFTLEPNPSEVFWFSYFG